MKKIVCRACGLVNLEGFVSFPHCAGCGVALPREAPPRWRRVLRRPIKPLYAALAVGGGLSLLALGVLGLARETRDSANEPLLVYAQVPHSAAPGAPITLRFTLDSAEESPAESLEGVSLRLGREMQRDFRVASLQPAPTRALMRGSGRYYEWEELPRGSTLRLSLAAKATARAPLRLRATIGAAQHRFYQLRSTLQVGPSATIQSAPDVAK